MGQVYSDDIEELLGAPRQAVPLPESAAPVPGGEGMVVGGAHEGASLHDHAVALWAPPIRSADHDILPEKRILDARVRDSVRNDSYVAGGANLHRDNIVGAAYMLNAKPEYKVLGLDDTWAEEFQEEVETKFTLYAESPRNYFDASRQNTFTELVRLAIGVYVGCGEVLASAEWMRDPDRPFKTALQMIDTDRLSNPWGQMDSRFLRGGVVRDRFGAPQGYHIRMAHPSDFMEPDAHIHKYVPVRKPWGRLQMLHIYEQQRPDQSRGISEMVSALKEMRTTKKFRDIVLQNAVVNATFAATIESELPPEAAFAALGGSDPAALGKYNTAFLAEIARYTGSTTATQLNGVKIPHLYPGTKLQLRPAGQGGPLGSEFEQSLLRYIAANLGVSYEQLSRDYTKTNYSSARAAMSESWKFMLARKRMVADRFADAAYMLWLEEAINKGEITSLPRRAPSWYEGLNAEAYAQCDWIGASRGQIDELKETQAAVLRLKYGLTTYEDEMGRLGKDWRKVFAQIERENRVMKERNLVLGANGDDKMMNAASGAPREKEAKDEKDDGSEDNTDV